LLPKGAGLPDGMIAYPKYHFGFVFDGLLMGIVTIFYGH
jgi:hypothetical protein